MSSIVEVIENAGVDFVGGTNDKIIELAEKELSFKFPDSYKEILKKFGVISIGSHEIFGLGVDGYLNVVEATRSERKRYPQVLEQFIIIQNLSMEGALILLNCNGEVFEFNNGNTKLISKSLLQYIQEEIIS
ncbi:SMI1/KNR4 family protein [Bacillus sp. JJ722]|uniref:SMI1/KNR4 family protein n=1 Tax=Bacillus sp. JJ722 TaxID=3122973 RepID=UPI002FFE87D6